MRRWNVECSLSTKMEKSHSECNLIPVYKNEKNLARNNGVSVIHLHLSKLQSTFPPVVILVEKKKRKEPFYVIWSRNFQVCEFRNVKKALECCIPTLNRPYMLKGLYISAIFFFKLFNHSFSKLALKHPSHVC